jgi:mannosyltransferase
MAPAPVLAGTPPQHPVPGESQPASFVGAAPSVPVLDAVRAGNGMLGRRPWVLPVLLMAALGLWRVGEPGMWGDELATWGMTTVRWSEMWRLLGERDAVLAPYYVLMHGWADLAGSSDVALRLPSVLAMTGTAALVAILGNRLAGPRVGLLGGLIFAVLPTSSRYAQEARPYAFTMCAAVLATVLLTVVLDRPGLGPLSAYAAAVALLGSLHLVALTLLGAHAVVVIRLRRRLFRQWIRAACIGGIPGLALLWRGSGQAGQIGWISKADLPTLLALPEQLIGLPLLAGVVLALAMVSLSLRQPAAVYPTLCATWALLPTVVIFVVGTLIPLATPRYLLFTLPAWVLLAATTLSRIPTRRAAALLLVIALTAVPAQERIRQPSGHGQGTRHLGTLLSAMARPGDGIVFASRNSVADWLGRDAVKHYGPVADRPKDLLALHPPRTGRHLAAAECRNVERCLGTTRRVWVVRVGELRDPLDGIGADRQQLLRRYALAGIWHPQGLTLALLVRGPQPAP